VDPRANRNGRRIRSFKAKNATKGEPTAVSERQHRGPSEGITKTGKEGRKNLHVKNRNLMGRNFEKRRKFKRKKGQRTKRAIDEKKGRKVPA